MKSVGNFYKALAFGVVVGGSLIASSVEARTLDNTAVVRSIQGSASYSLDNGRTWQTARTGHIYRPPTMLRTMPDSFLDLDLGDNGPAVRLTPSTVLGLDRLRLNTTELDTVTDTQLDLREGRILGVVRRMTAGSRYEVKTPRGVAGVRGTGGTEYDISANGTVHVVTGQVVMVYIDPADPSRPPVVVTVNAGETATPPVSPGEPPVISAIPDIVVSDMRDFLARVDNYLVSPFPPIPVDSPEKSHTPFEPRTPAPPVVVVPQPEPFISPINPAALRRR
jgi:hypothetical protein